MSYDVLTEGILNDWGEEIKRLRAENALLREALKTIQTWTSSFRPDPGYIDAEELIDNAMRLCDKSLAPKEVSDE